ncbi:MAG: hypothetical protein Q9226_006608 [Calogaya cf. arnoldii]
MTLEVLLQPCNTSSPSPVTHTRPTMSSYQPTTSSPKHLKYDNLITLLYTKLPQELFDRIEDALSDLARPELLRLSRAIYQKYHVRMRQENRYVVKIASGKMRSVELVRGHVGAPLAYLDSIGEDQDTIETIRFYQSFFDSDPSLVEPPTVSMYPRSSENPPESWAASHGYAGGKIAYDLKRFEKEEEDPITIPFLLLNSYGPSGEWTGDDWEDEGLS